MYTSLRKNKGKDRMTGKKRRKMEWQMGEDRDPKSTTLPRDHGERNMSEIYSGGGI